MSTEGDIWEPMRRIISNISGWMIALVFRLGLGQAMGMGFFLLGQDRKILYANEQAIIILGWSKKKVRQRKLSDRRFQEIGQGSFEIFLTDDQGQEYRAAGRRFGPGLMAVVIVELTRRQKVEKERIEFVSVTAHELRTPINVNKWTIELLLGGDVGSLTLEQRELIHQMRKSNRRMSELVDDLLEILRIDEGRFELKKKKIDLVKVLNSILGEMAVGIREKNLDLDWERPGKPTRVDGDARRLGQVYRNLLSNAMKYSRPKGEILVRVFKKELEEDGERKDYVVSQISDRGMGIPADEQPRIFDRFFRASNARASQVQGTGLGLPLSKEIVELHGGKIWFKSKEGEGSTFYFAIPKSN